ncbi:MAG: hypothetical protein IJN39_04050, partial [Clostridia bacterium]|nr:hypothetical protein [Clostridia bacterium]
MKKFIDESELKERTELNYKRFLNDSYYLIERIFSPSEYSWYGDKEGRALLSFVSHYKISGRKIPCMEQMMELFPEKLNEKGYLGKIVDGVVSEQQLSGHSWLLRGLCEHYEQFGDKFSLDLINSITENLFIPTKGMYSTYPIDRSGKKEGDVSGSEIGIFGSWILSSDIGCAFMSIDGLSHAYKVTKNSVLKEIVDEQIKVYLSIDKPALKAQTHCTLTAARGMMRMYTETGEKEYLEGAKSIYELYVHGGGMTYTYQNLNWWNRSDSWTEPCAIVDSLMLSLELYKATKNEEYRITAARIYHNGLSTSQRSNGGAGTDVLICEGSEHKEISARLYEAPFCCTMRLSEGLWYINENKDLLYATINGNITKDENGIYSDGDIIYVLPDASLTEYAEDFVETEGVG